MASRSDTGGIFLSDNIWSKDKPENREDPQELIENNGWGESYSQAGGDPVQRKLMNRNFYKHGSLAYDINRYGILPWHKDITYEVGAVAIGSDNKIYRAEVQNTNKDPVINAGTEWKLAQFNTINGTQGNVTVAKDAKNNLTINTAVNLESKANKTLDNVNSGDLLGKFQDTPTVKWASNNKKIQSITPDGAITTAKIANGNVTTDKLANNAVTHDKVANTNNVDKAAWAAKIATSAHEPNAIVSRDNLGRSHYSTVYIDMDTDDVQGRFERIAVSLSSKYLRTTTIDNFKEKTGIAKLENQLNSLIPDLGETSQTNSLAMVFKTGKSKKAHLKIYGAFESPGSRGELQLKSGDTVLKSLIFSAFLNTYSNTNYTAHPYFEYVYTSNAQYETINSLSLFVKQISVNPSFNTTIKLLGYSSTPF